MSTEQKNALIRQAIQELPSYEVPSHVWPTIQDQLEIDQKEELIQDAIPKLPAYQAPESIWSSIAAEIAHPPQRTRPGIIRLVQRPLSWAASLLLVVAAYFLLTNNRVAEVNYAFTTEPINQFLLEADWDTDEAEFAEVVQLYNKYVHTFNDPIGPGLQAEFSELNEARNELKNTLEQYGKDQELIRQLAAIERARTQVIKQMAQKI